VSSGGIQEEACISLASSTVHFSLFWEWDSLETEAWKTGEACLASARPQGSAEARWGGRGRFKDTCRIPEPEAPAFLRHPA
jgi:hypothetical protein